MVAFFKNFCFFLNWPGRGRFGHVSATPAWSAVEQAAWLKFQREKIKKGLNLTSNEPNWRGSIARVGNYQVRHGRVHTEIEN